jgi:hypothetical protein
MNTTPPSRRSHARNALYAGAFLSLVATIAGSSFVLNARDANANCFEETRTSETDCYSGCVVPQGEGTDDCDWRPELDGNHYCLQAGNFCYSD